MSTDHERVLSNESCSKTSGPESNASKAELITVEQAKSFINILNSDNNDQLFFLVSGSMYEDPRQLKDLVKNMWTTKHKDMHFLFRVEDLVPTTNGKTRCAVSAKGQRWGYLSLTTDLESTKYGSFRANLPSNLLQFFRPVFEEVVQLTTGTRMTKYPPRPSLIPFKSHIKDDDDKEGMSSKSNRGVHTRHFKCT